MSSGSGRFASTQRFRTSAALVVGVAAGVLVGCSSNPPASSANSATPSVQSPTTDSASVVSAPTTLRISQVLESSDNTMPANAKGASPSAADLAAYSALDCSATVDQGPQPKPLDPAAFIAVCGQPDGSSARSKYLLGPAVIQNQDVATASASADPDGDWGVWVTFTPTATVRWKNFTESHVGGALAILLNGEVKTVAVLASAITGPTELRGSFSKQNATLLAAALTPN